MKLERLFTLILFALQRDSAVAQERIASFIRTRVDSASSSSYQDLLLRPRALNSLEELDSIIGTTNHNENENENENKNEQQTTTANVTPLIKSTGGRVLEDDGGTELVFVATYESQVNGTHPFPDSLDPDCAVGQNVAVGVSTLQVETINTATGRQVFVSTVRWLFKDLVAPDLLPSGSVLKSPRVVYDRVESRFFVAATMTDEESFSRIYLAISNEESADSAAALDWNVLAVDVWDRVEDGDNVWGVWAKDIVIATDSTNLYITATMYRTRRENATREAQGIFVESRVWVFNKSALLSSFTSTPSALETAIDGTIGTTAAAITDAMTISDSSNNLKLGPYQIATNFRGSGAFLVAYDNESSDSDDTRVHVVSLKLPTDDEVDVSEEMVSLGAVDDATEDIPDAAQPDSQYSKVQTGDRRVADATIHEDSLSIAMTIEDGDESAIFWATLDVSSKPFTLSASGSIRGEGIAEGTSTFYPSIAVSSDGDVVVAYGASGPEIFTGMYASKATTEESDPVTIKAGRDNYENLDGLAYYGDYSGLSASPSDDGCFWAFNTFAQDTTPLSSYTWARGALANQWGKVCLE